MKKFPAMPLVLQLFFAATLSIAAMTALADKPHKVVIQVSTDDPRTQQIALNNAVNVQKHYGIDNVDIQIVAYGPGLGLVTEQSEHKDRIASMLQYDIAFSACENTMNTIEAKTGNKPVPLDGVGNVPSGVVQIMELQEQGYSYIRP